MSEHPSEKLCVMGLGYIGLPTASMFATHGFDVLGVDVRPEIVATINRGEIHISEPGLATLAKAAVNSGRLRAALAPEPSDAFFIAVPTPALPDRRADLSYVVAAAEAIAPILRKGNLVVLESTSPPRTTADVVGPILEKSGLKAGRDFHLAHTPERVLPGQILKELIDNDRVIGGLDRPSAEAAEKLYRVFVAGRIFLTDATTAEMVKLMENTFRDVNIALANELARICDRLGVSAWEVIALANRHPRLNLHRPGPGVGGHCIAVDPWFIVESAPDLARLIRMARETNDAQPAYVIGLIEGAIAGQDSPKLTFLGAAYKGGVDDVRESPALEIIEHFAKSGAAFSVYDPHVSRASAPLGASLEEALRDSTCVALLVDHPEFAGLDPAWARSLVKTPVLVETRNQLDLARWSAAGFKTILLGGGGK